MAVTRAKKVEQAERLGEDLKKVSNLIVTTYSKLTVAQDFELRKTVRNSGAKYVVVKNTLAERAAKGTKVEAALSNLSGVTSIAYHRFKPGEHALGGGACQGARQVCQGQPRVFL